MKSAIAYYRVSTERQRRSGLGIEAQRATVARFAEAEGFALGPRHPFRTRRDVPHLGSTEPAGEGGGTGLISGSTSEEYGHR